MEGVRVDGLYFGVVTYYCQFSLLYNFASYDSVDAPFFFYPGAADLCIHMHDTRYMSASGVMRNS